MSLRGPEGIGKCPRWWQCLLTLCPDVEWLQEKGKNREKIINTWKTKCSQYQCAIHDAGCYNRILQKNSHQWLTYTSRLFNLYTCFYCFILIISCIFNSNMEAVSLSVWYRTSEMKSNTRDVSNNVTTILTFITFNLARFNKTRHDLTNFTTALLLRTPKSTFPRGTLWQTTVLSFPTTCDFSRMQRRCACPHKNTSIDSSQETYAIHWTWCSRLERLSLWRLALLFRHSRFKLQLFFLLRQNYTVTI